MKLARLNVCPDSTQATLIFGGFGFKASAYEFENAYLLHDYLDAALPDLSELEGKQIRLIAYSLGVMMAARADLSALNISRRIAVAGSVAGIDDELGIPKRAYRASIRSMSAASFAAACGDSALAANLHDHLQAELIALQEHAKLPVINPHFDALYIARRDVIFPAAALEAGDFAMRFYLDCGHFCINNLHE